MSATFSLIKSLSEDIGKRLEGRKPLVGIVLGSGLGQLADIITSPVVLPYKEIPGFPESNVIGHKGNFICGYIGDKCVIAMQGRFHYYEGHPMDIVTLPVRVMVLLGIRYLFVSNAAGGVNFDFRIGDLMIIKDHIGLLPNPLIGPNIDEFGPRFPDMTRPYDKELIAESKKIAKELGMELKEGVYLGSTGPTYETPAEYRFYRMAGADAVGMSTIPEVIAARHAGIRVFGMSVITNEAHDDYPDDFENDGAKVVEAADAAAGRMSQIFKELIESIS